MTDNTIAVHYEQVPVKVLEYFQHNPCKVGNNEAAQRFFVGLGFSWGADPVVKWLRDPYLVIDGSGELTTHKGGIVARLTAPTFKSLEEVRGEVRRIMGDSPVFRDPRTEAPAPEPERVAFWDSTPETRDAAKLAGLRDFISICDEIVAYRDQIAKLETARIEAIARLKQDKRVTYLSTHKATFKAGRLEHTYHFIEPTETGPNDTDNS